jgi:hypothetical protein
MLRRLALVRTDVSEERIASILRVTRIGKRGNVLRMLVTSNVPALFTGETDENHEDPKSAWLSRSRLEKRSLPGYV